MAPAIFSIPGGKTMGAYNGFLAGAAATSSRSAQDGGIELDASAAAGIGLGDPRKSIGVDTYLGIISVNPEGKDGGFGVGEDGNLSFKVGTTLLTDEYDTVAIAAGVNNLVAWGDAERINENYYGVVSIGTAVEMLQAIVPVSVSLGAGSKQKDNERFGVFAGLGVKLSTAVDMSAGYNASRWVGGMTFNLSQTGVPILRDLIMQVGVDDIFDTNHNRRGVFIVALPFSL
ncbi:hypothetical protein [Prosthecochloris sp. CIB 2401]|uniref:hypothetical protein n=1 Tax=Prosthecochloris sp. CIB 2401 TaxID=1868325 RepID=UPI00083A44A6|nr:hypothetical protein [Prosthecochloris sp. CIB 2401]